MLEILEAAGTVLLCQVLAPWTFMRWPSFGSLKVKKVTVREAEDHTDVPLAEDWGKGAALVFSQHEGHLPKRTVIEYENSNHSRGWFTIDHENQTVDCNDGGMLTEPYGGSGELGLIFIGLPGLLLFSPILILNAIIWWLIESATGMNRYKLAVWLKTKNQLDPETRQAFKLALKH